MPFGTNDVEIFGQDDELVDESPKTSILEDLKTAVSSVANTADTGLSLLASLPARVISGKDEQDSIFKNLNQRIESRNQWANPQQKRQGLGGELISGAAGLLPNLVLSPLSPVETGKRFLDAGESGYRTTAAVGTDALGQILGYKIGARGPTALSRIFTGGAANAAQDVATRGIIQQIASTPEMQQAHEFSPSSTILSAAMGGAFGGLSTPKKKPNTGKGVDLAGLKAIANESVDIPQRTDKGLTLDKVAQETKDQQAYYNRTPELFNPLRRYGEPNAVDHSQQVDLPFTEGPEAIREAQVEGDPQRDMFVEQSKQDRAFDPVMEDMQTRLFEDAIERPAKEQEVEQAYAQRKEQQQLEESVSRLQNKFQVPKGQRGAIDFSFEDKRNKQLVDEENAYTKQMYKEMRQGEQYRAFDYLANTAGKFFNDNKYLLQKVQQLRDLAPWIQDQQLDHDASLSFSRLEDAFKRFQEAVDSPDKAPLEAQNVKFLLDEFDHLDLQNKYLQAVRETRASLNMRKPYERQMARQIDSVLNNTISIPKKQRGAVDLNGFSKKVADLTEEDVAPLKDNVRKAKTATLLLGTDEGFRSNFTTPEEVVAAAPEYKDIRKDQLMRGKTITNGINRIAGATNNPFIKYVRDTVRKGFRSAENFARIHITDKQGMGPLWERMSQDEKNAVWQVWGIGDEKEKVFTPEQLRSHGMTETQVEFMQKLYKASDELYSKAQESYEKAGLKGFRKRPGWRPGVFTGDYKTIFSVPKMKDGVAVLDKQGKPVYEPIGIISADTSWQRNRIIKKLSDELKQKYPGAKAEDLPRTNLGGKGKSVTMLGDMAKIMDLLGGNDAAFKEVQDKIKEITAQVGSEMYGANLHAIEKKGIFGSEGSKPWKDINTNTNEGMKAFFKYLEEAAMSYEMLKTQTDVTGLMNNPALDHMQNAKEYIAEYMRHATGRGVGDTGGAFNTLLDKPFEMLGVGPSVPRAVVHQLSKRMGQLTMGMFNMPFLVMQLVQVPQTAIPEMLGLARNADVSTPEFTKALGKASIDAVTALTNKWFDTPVEGFQKDILDYAHDNGLMNFSEFEDVSKITQGKVGRTFDRMADWNRIAGEAATRPFVFFAFARMLENSGLPKKEILDLAYNKTQYAMIDYTAPERPMMYNKMGEIGKMGGALKTFQHGFMGQQVDWMRRFSQGDVAPLLSGLAIFALTAGITGATGYEEADKLFGAITDKMGKRQTIRETALKNLPTWAQDGFLSDYFNINVQSRLGMADVAPNSFADFITPYATTMGNMIGSATDLALDPNETTAKNAALAWSPSSTRGLVENALFKDEKTGARLDKEERLDYPRTDWDWKLRQFGLTSMEESKNKQRLWTDSLSKLSDDEARKKVLTKMKIGVRRDSGFVQTEDFTKYKDIYIARGGDPTTLMSALEQDLIESRKTRKQRMEGVPSGSIGSLNRYKAYNAD